MSATCRRRTARCGPTTISRCRGRSTRAAEKRLKEIARAVKGADHLYLATDPDREGEAISWHVEEVLRQRKALKGVDVKRVVFNEVTKQAVLDAFQHPRELDRELVDAYLARRALDYLVGFTLSPVLWRKLPGSRSAGRVQSVALRLVCEREAEIEAFKPREYWTVEVEFVTPSGERFTARLTHLDGKRLDKFDLANETAGARRRRQDPRARRTTRSTTVERKQIRRTPPPPFTTSTLQQEASRKLGFGASRTMRIAQRLYEGVDIDGETVGLITYMRTDGVTLSNEAIAARAPASSSSDYGNDYRARRAAHLSHPGQERAGSARGDPPDRHVPPPATRSRAISMTSSAGSTSSIWKRAVASQMAAALIDQVAVDIAPADGSVALARHRLDRRLRRLPHALSRGRGRSRARTRRTAACRRSRSATRSTRGEVTPLQHFTQPPPRYTEASLVKKLEELGIGRPSTYASILQVLQDRNYVRLDKKRFMPEDRGRLVTAFLTSFFERYVEYGFTADLENKLDDISGGRIPWQQGAGGFLARFLGRGRRHQGPQDHPGASTRSTRCWAGISSPTTADGRDPRLCPVCQTGPARAQARPVRRLHRLLELSRLPLHAAAWASEKDGEAGNGAEPAGPRELGIDPATGLPVSLRKGPYGIYVQLGDRREKPKRSSLPKGMSPADVDARDGAASCWRCRARSAPIPRTASRSSPASAASAPISGTARISARSRRTTTC